MSNTETIYAPLYVRISKDKTGRAAGVKRQEKESRETALEAGITITDVIIDNDKSATNGMERPGFERLLERIASGEVTTVVCWDPDRLYRLDEDLQRLIKAKGKNPLVIISHNYNPIDLSTARGRTMAKLFAVLATDEIEHKAERQLSETKERALSGEWRLTWRPFGYDITPSGKRNIPATVTVNKAEAEVLRALYKRYYEDGASRYQLMRELNAQGVTTATGKPWTITQLREVLSNPHYAGIVTHNGIEFEDVAPLWQPIIDRETFYRYRQAAETRSVVSTFTREATSLLSGILICGKCQAPMYRRARSDGKHDYVCSARSHLSVGVSRAETAVVKELVTGILFGRSSGPTEPLRAQYGAVLEALSKVIQTRADIIELIGSVLTKEQAASKLAKLNADEDALKAERDEIARRSAVVSVLGDAKQLFISETPNGHTASFEGLAEARAVVTQNFNALALDRQRELVKLYLSVTVNPATHTKRFDIHHRVATDLNEE